GDSMGMNPLYTLVLLFLGFKFYGLGGMIIAVPIGMIVEDLYRGGMFDGLIENCKLLGQEIRRLRGLEPDEGDNE
ncbi:MAG: AI-2E family transporter, partial [Lachnospiraceae bacterium]|nr:AI-2E family transporter [Lachnospiraceae bacterium]